MRLPALLALVCFAAALPASAQDKEASDAIPARWIEDAEAGHYEDFHRPIPCTVNSISLTMRMSNPRRLSKWLPLIRLDVGTERHSETADPNRRNIMVSFADDTSQQLPYMVGAVELVIGGKPVRQPMRQSFRYARDIAVKLSWTPDGVVNIDVDGAKLVGAIGKAPTSLRFFVSSASAEFNSIQTAWQPLAALPTPNCPLAAPAATPPQ